MDASKRLDQHVGGMVLSRSSLPDRVPVRPGATHGRFIMDWDKDSVADAKFAKTDLLSLPVLDQLEEALDLIETEIGQRLRSRHLLDLAFQVALIRPGVGFQGSAVSDFVSRYRQGAA